MIYNVAVETGKLFLAADSRLEAEMKLGSAKLRAWPVFFPPFILFGVFFTHQNGRRLPDIESVRFTDCGLSAVYLPFLHAAQPEEISIGS